MEFNVVMIIPTGIGAEIGGHAGDANPTAKLIGSVCDNLILHPNVVNASDINEMLSNALYVEGGMLDEFFMARTSLVKSRANKILLVTNPPVAHEIINAASAARMTLGAEVDVMELKTPLEMTGLIERGVATGHVDGVTELIEQVLHLFARQEYDALAISSPIVVDQDTAMEYLEHGGVNPWGGVEAMVSRRIGESLGVPVAHAPQEHIKSFKFNEVVDPRMAAEVISITYIFCVLKGLYKAPRMGHFSSGDMIIDDIDVLVSPWGCEGPPHTACISRNIPVIIVKENITTSKIMTWEHPNFIVVENYHEAVGVLVGMREGISRESVRRPVRKTKVLI